MRKVLLNKYTYTYKDIFRWLGIGFLHILGFVTYVALILSLHLIIDDEHFFPNITSLNWGIFYPATIAPILSAILHIVYAERGFTNIKALIWLHALANIILVPVIVFAL